MAESIIPDSWEADRWRLHVRARMGANEAYRLLRDVEGDLRTLARNPRHPFPAYAAPMAEARTALDALQAVRRALESLEYASDEEVRR